MVTGNCEPDTPRTGSSVNPQWAIFKLVHHRSRQDNGRRANLPDQVSSSPEPVHRIFGSGFKRVEKPHQRLVFHQRPFTRMFGFQLLTQAVVSGKLVGDGLLDNHKLSISSEAGSAKSGTIASMKSFHLALLATTLTLPMLAQDAPRKPSAVLQEACGACHGLNRLDTSRSRSEWKDTVERMVANGADVKANEMDSLVGFITRFYGETVDINKATAQQLQDELDMTPVEAEMIVKARGANGNFKNYADVQKSGIDAKRIDPIKDRLKYN